MIVEKCQAFHHPGIEAAAGMFGDLAYDVRAILEPLQLGARSGGEDCRLAIFTLITVLHRIESSRPLPLNR